MKYLLVSIAIVIALSAWGRPAQASFILNKPSALGLNNGLVGWWTFDGKDVAGDISSTRYVFDRSGQGNRGAYWNATGTPPAIGKIGQGLSFDGVNDYVEVPHTSALMPSQITMSAWTKRNGSQAATFVSVVDKHTSSGNGYQLELKNNNWLNMDSREVIRSPLPRMEGLAASTCSTWHNERYWRHDTHSIAYRRDQML
jgi:hypothetical protein